MAETYRDPSAVDIASQHQVAIHQLQLIREAIEKPPRKVDEDRKLLKKLIRVGMECLETHDKTERVSGTQHSLRRVSIESDLIATLLLVSQRFDFSNCTLNEYLLVINLRLYLQMLIRALNVGAHFPDYTSLTNSGGRADLAAKTTVFTPLLNIQNANLSTIIEALPNNFRPLAIFALSVERHIYDEGNSAKLKTLVDLLRNQVQLTFDDLPDIIFRIFFQSPYRIDEDPNYEYRSYIAKSMTSGKTVNKDPQLAQSILENLDQESRTWLIIHEKTGRDHAMYRCWAPFIDYLKNTQTIIEMAPHANSEENLHELPKDLKSLESFVSDKGIQVIFYPSIGMEELITKIAHHRVTEVQVAGSGHPGEFPGMPIDLVVAHGDYGALHDEWFDLDTLYDWQPYDHSGLTKIDNKGASPLRRDGKTPIIGIPSKTLKLSDSFLNFLEDLTETIGRVELEFFPGELDGIGYRSAANLIARRFPRALIHRMNNYDEYMKDLSKIDVVISPFPFGNSNGLHDCLALKKPIFCLRHNRSVQSWSDSLVLTRKGRHDGVATSLASLKQKIIKFIA